jgi:hypothetical protein
MQRSKSPLTFTTMMEIRFSELVMIKRKCPSSRLVSLPLQSNQMTSVILSMESWNWAVQ